MSVTANSMSKGARYGTWITVVLCTLVLSAGFGGFQLLASLKKPPAKRTPETKVFQVHTHDIELTDLPEVLTAFGTARSHREVVISAQVAGNIVETLDGDLRVGRAVFAAEAARGTSKADGAGESLGAHSPGITTPPPAGTARTGDVLLRIEPDTYRQRLAQAERRLAEDDAEEGLLRQQEENLQRSLAKSRKDAELQNERLVRVEDLRRKKVGTEEELTSARLEAQAFQEAILKVENELRLIPVRRDQLAKRRETHRVETQLAQLDLERTTIRPPFSGVLAQVFVERGQYVRVGDPLVKVLDISRVEIPIGLPLSDMARIAPLVASGAELAVQLAEHESAPARWFGRLVRVAPQADQATRTVQAFVMVENGTPSNALLPGTFTHARIEVPSSRQAIVIPRDSVIGERVLVAENGRAAARKVQLGATLKGDVVIEAGLEVGDRVITTNLDVLNDLVRQSDRRGVPLPTIEVNNNK